MYSVTFYSYKGGVGRSMALVNTAYLLAQSGKRVLAVDFDLEAPGLSSYGPFRCAGERKGIVEYVLEYEETNAAPDVSEFIMECAAGEHSIWLMPAGQHTAPSYAAKFSSINWQRLYDEREGFLLFEDLKQQWAQYDGQGFDYVLIDSRTGHTDIGGICTRQLPDAVVIMFLPTPQNIEGLRPIVRAIKRETAPVRKNRIRLHFCPSNLPDLDDQELILRDLLEQAKESLGYPEAAAEIHHYGSLDLLQQPIYAEKSPKSRLAREYEELKTSIVGFNLTDREGALVALERLRDEYYSARMSEIQAARMPEDRSSLETIQLEAALIAGSFPNDADIAWGLAELANQMTRPTDELAALNTVINSSGAGKSYALLRRSNVLATLNESRNAISDIRALLTTPGADAFEIVPAIDLLRQIAPNEWRVILEDSSQSTAPTIGGRYQMLMALLDRREDADHVAKLAMADAPGPHGQSLYNLGILALMSGGHYETAMRHLARRRQIILESKALPNVFNYMFCEWAVSGVAPLDLADRVLILGAQYSQSLDPNALQCFALCNALLDQWEEAQEAMRKARVGAQRATTSFSCWRYLSVSAKDMLEDLDEMDFIIQRHGTFNAPGIGALKGTNPQ